MHSVGDLVLCQPYWDFGVAHGYDIKPGRVISILLDEGGDIYEVQWPDGHISLEGFEELRPVVKS